jgi:hypothetical protein
MLATGRRQRQKGVSTTRTLTATGGSVKRQSSESSINHAKKTYHHTLFLLLMIRYVRGVLTGRRLLVLFARCNTRDWPASSPGGLTVVGGLSTHSRICPHDINHRPCLEGAICQNVPLVDLRDQYAGAPFAPCRTAARFETHQGSCNLGPAIMSCCYLSQEQVHLCEHPLFFYPAYPRWMRHDPTTIANGPVLEIACPRYAVGHACNLQSSSPMPARANVHRRQT